MGCDGRIGLVWFGVAWTLPTTTLGSLFVGPARPPPFFILGDLGDAAGFDLLVPVPFLLSLVAAGWLVVPAFILDGWYHERARGADRRAPRTSRPRETSAPGLGRSTR